jgi:heptosyltransferase-2
VQRTKRGCARIFRAAAGKGIVDLSGLTTVEQLAALIARCRIFVTNDTGAMHICVIQRVPGVFIFGGGSLTRFAPFEDKERYAVIHRQQPCSPCNKFSCDRLTCLKKIAVQDVFDGIQGLRKKYY